MAISEILARNEEKQQAKPKTTAEARENIEEKIRKEAEKLAEDSGFQEILKNNLDGFLENHQENDFKGYRKWNADFCENVLNEKSLNAGGQRIKVMALQLFLNKNVGGFTSALRQQNSIDGMFGRFTLGKMLEYASKKEEPQESAQKQKTPESILQTNKSKEKFSPENIFYAGDSYMVGALAGQKIERSKKAARVSSHLVRTKGFDTQSYRKNKVFIEEEAIRHLNDPNCKILVINGGLNDLYSKGPSKQVIDSIKEAYGNIIKKAHQLNKKVAVYTMNEKTTAKGKQSPAWVRQINKAAHEINQWLKDQSGADNIIDTTAIIAGRLKKDGVHPDRNAYRDLSKAVMEISV